MKAAIFLDTGYFLALIRKRDACHEAARAASAMYKCPFVTTDLVLVEFANALSKPPYRSTATVVIDAIREDENIRVVPFDSGGMKKALALYKERPDKEWGLVYCYSFVVMKEAHLHVALSFDEHFRQAGFDTPLLTR